MHLRYVLNQLGLLLVGMAALLLGIAAWSGYELWRGDEAEREALFGLLSASGIGLAVGGLAWLVTRKKDGAMLGRREALLLVGVSWIIGAGLSAVPFYLWAQWVPESAGVDPGFRSPINCYFEAMSGLTTTGATILRDIESIPRSLLLWRSLTHWLGGLGIVVLFVAVLPMVGVGGKKLFRVEAPGPSPEGVHPHIRETARILWFIYTGLTLAEIIALRFAGMDWFESTCHTFGTLATGGFSTRNASLGGFDSVAVDVIVMVFMVLAGVNFGLYFQLIRRRYSSVWKDAELRLYLTFLVVISVVTVISLVYFQVGGITTTTGETVPATIGESIRQGVFTTVSVQTTTGFCTSDFNLWPFLPKALLVLSMFVGGCAGSTGGGIKVIRILIAFRVILHEIERSFRPNVVRPLKVGASVIDPELKLATVGYVLGVVVLFAVGSGVIMLLESAANGCDYTTAATASAATLFNIGPGLARVGAIENYAWFSDASKITMCLLMALGRLEIFAIAVLFIPRFWRSY